MDLKKIVNDAVLKAGSRQKLANILGISRISVQHWVTGDSAPSVSSLKNLLAYLGGDMDRALPEYSPGAPAPLLVVGFIPAGAETVVFEQPDKIDIEHDIWQSSDASPFVLINPSHPIRYLRVFGDSMEPDFSNGAVVAIGETTLQPQSLPDLTPCIFQETTHQTDMTFKLLQVHKKNGKAAAIFGIPINKTHPVQVWRLGEVRVPYIVLGKIEPTRFRKPTNNHKQPTVFRDE